MVICPECNGEGKIITKVEKPVTLTTKEWIDEETPCEMCGGMGYLPEERWAEIIERLDMIIDILKLKEK